MTEGLSHARLPGGVDGLRLVQTASLVCTYIYIYKYIDDRRTLTRSIIRWGLIKTDAKSPTGCLPPPVVVSY